MQTVPTQPLSPNPEDPCLADFATALSPNPEDPCLADFATALSPNPEDPCLADFPIALHPNPEDPCLADFPTALHPHPEDPCLADFATALSPNPEDPCLADFPTALHPHPEDSYPADCDNEALSQNLENLCSADSVATVSYSALGNGGEAARAMLAELNGNFRQVFWGLISLVGKIVIGFLGSASSEVLSLREASAEARIPVASGYAAIRSYVFSLPRGESNEDTDSGLTMTSSQEEVEAPWETMHEIFEESPMYRNQMVENAFEIWLWNRRPWSNNLREYPFLDGLFDLELIAFQAMVEWYYNRTPSSRRSATTTHPVMGAEGRNQDDEHVRGIIQRLIADRVIIQDSQGVLWSGPRIPTIEAEGLSQAAGANPTGTMSPGISVLSVQELQAMQERSRRQSRARSSHETPYPEDTSSSRGSYGSRRTELGPFSREGTGARSSNEPPLTADQTSSAEDQEEGSLAAESETMSEGTVTSEDLEAHDQHIAQAAFVLWTENLSFDWTQLSDRQQDLYHAMVGRYFQSMNDD